MTLWICNTCLMPLRITCAHLGRTANLPWSSQGRLLWVWRFLALRCHIAPGTEAVVATQLYFKHAVAQLLVG